MKKAALKTRAHRMSSQEVLSRPSKRASSESNAAPSAHISVVIPNYNGRHLLEENLPSVLKALRSGDEVIIVDDASPDDSVKWLQQQFSAKPISIPSTAHHLKPDDVLMLGSWSDQKKRGKVKILQHHQNQRYGKSCNDGVELAEQPFIFLLNSDVRPTPTAIPPLLGHFDSTKNPFADQVFAVGCLEHEPNAEKSGSPQVSGKNSLWFSRGMFVHSRAREFSSGDTAWVSGGSGMFSREKWLALGGFDLDYRPAYWEDIDLSFRARKHGWRVLFESQSLVEHRHESTNTSAFGATKMESMSWQNGVKFVQKHATWAQRLQHWVWQPYWWLRAKKMYWFEWSLVTLTVIAAALRLYQLGNVPYGMTWDEAAIGYNGYAVLTTRRDEWLTRLPLSFRSFGDYKAPLAIYLNGPFTYVLGMTLFAVRLPFALVAILAIPAMALLMKELVEWLYADSLHERWGEAEVMGLAAAALFTFSPWHLHFSRVGFESGMALSFFLWGAWALLRAFRRPLLGIPTSVLRFRQASFGILASVALAASMYTYHSAKVAAPALAGMLFAMAVGKKWRTVWPVGIGIVSLSSLLLWPLIQDTLWGNGSVRFTQASILSQGSPFDHLGKISYQLLLHFSPQFLFFGQTETLRHGDGHWGVLLLSEGVLILASIIGAVQLSRNHWKTQQKLPRSLLLFVLSWAWIAIGFLPAAIGVDVPHANRGLFALPGFILAAVFGGRWLYGMMKETKLNTEWAGSKNEQHLVMKSFFGTLILIHGVFFLAYTRDYYTRFAAQSTSAFSDGYLEAFSVAKKYEPSVEKILFTNAYGQPYIYALFARRTNPIWYQGGSLVKYEFTDHITVGDLARPNTLIVATPEQIPIREANQMILGADGSVRFVVVYPKP